MAVGWHSGMSQAGTQQQERLGAEGSCAEGATG